MNLPFGKVMISLSQFYVAETVHQDVIGLKAKLNTTQAMLEFTENEVSHFALVVQDLEFVNS